MRAITPALYLYYHVRRILYALIYYNNGRASLNIQKDQNVHNVKLCDELANILRLPKLEKYEGLTEGDVVDESAIRLTFSNTDLLYLKCAEIDASNVLENSTNSTLMSIIPLEFSTHNNKLIQFKDTKLLFHDLTQRKTVYQLHFSIEDPDGNQLPFHKCVFSVLNK